MCSPSDLEDSTRRKCSLSVRPHLWGFQSPGFSDRVQYALPRDPPLRLKSWRKCLQESNEDCLQLKRSRNVCESLTSCITHLTQCTWLSPALGNPALLPTNPHPGCPLKTEYQNFPLGWHCPGMGEGRFMQVKSTAMLTNCWTEELRAALLCPDWSNKGVRSASGLEH